MNNNIISVSYNDLISSKDITKLIKQAYGLNGLGIILVTDYPNLGEKKTKLLKLSQIKSKKNTYIKKVITLLDGVMVKKK